MFGFAKPQFGPYTTTDGGRSGTHNTKKKTKEGSDFGADISSEGVDFDQSKYLSILKTKNYKIQLATLTDTTNAVFAISSVSKEKRQTLFGKMISKNDEGKDEVLNYTRDVTGVIITNANEKPWIFCIDNYTSGSRITANSYYPSAGISNAYLKNGTDSLVAEMNSSFDADLVLTNSNGEHIAALKFGQAPACIWIRNDLDKAYQQSIAAFFAVIIGIRDL